MNTINRATPLTPEQDRAIINKSWQIFNAKLNEGLVWSEAKKAAIGQIKQARDDFDQTFQPEAYTDEVGRRDPVKGELVWELRMDQFNHCLKNLEDI